MRKILRITRVKAKHEEDGNEEADARSETSANRCAYAALQSMSVSLPVARPDRGEETAMPKLTVTPSTARAPGTATSEAPVRGEPEPRMDDAAEVDVVAARARQDPRQVAVHEAFDSVRIVPIVTIRRTFCSGQSPAANVGTTASTSPSAYPSVLKTNTSNGPELPDQPGRLAHEEAARLHGRRARLLSLVIPPPSAGRCSHLGTRSLRT